MIDDTNNLFNTDRISSAFSGDALNTLKNFCLLYTLTVLRWIKYDMGILGWLKIYLKESSFERIQPSLDHERDWWNIRW
jgi:hypothetical protein